MKDNYVVTCALTGGGDTTRKNPSIPISPIAKQMVDNHPEIAAILLQCSDMPPFAAAIQDGVQLPVFDMTSIVEWAARAAMRRPRTGI